MSSNLHYDWVETRAGHSLVTRIEPDVAQHNVLIVPPFAEEMNRCRRLLIETSRMLTAHGIVSHIIDLPGTGDTPTRFADVHWDDWLAALVEVAAYLAKDIQVVGLRLGAVLAVKAFGDQRPVLAVNPVDGHSQRRQLLRARLLSGIEAGEAQSMAGLEAIWASGGSLNMAGYDINAVLARALEQARLPDPLPPAVSRTDLATEGVAPWLQVEPEAPDAYAVALTQAVHAWLTA